jgi:hypothetical protein
MGQAVGGEYDVTGLTGEAGERDAQPTHIFTLKMATVMFAETMDIFQHSTRLIPESRSLTCSNHCFVLIFTVL